MNYLPLIILLFLFLKGGKGFSPTMIPPLITLFKNMPNLNMNDILKGNIDFSALAPVVQAVTDLASAKATPQNTAYAESQTQPDYLKPISNIANSDITYSLNNYFRT